MSTPSERASALTDMSAAVSTEPIPTKSLPILDRKWIVPRVSQKVLWHFRQRHLRCPCSVPHLVSEPSDPQRWHLYPGLPDSAKDARNAIADSDLPEQERPVCDTSPGLSGGDIGRYR